MTTKWIMIIALVACWLIYNVGFNPEDKGGYLSGIGQFFKFIISLLILFFLLFLTSIVF